ncbi:MAG: Crp/Fnr family transcriptional regulator [Pseudomonas sp.]|uniref:Crp/Fnr family transcriptional regulator n=1 Tax=Pseudomonas sp. TaxID=306 RepID=UPI002734980D|nr:Crp/Fnr family transcriptional regulator [Pseudomonas sp.]MDP3848691.1 Crp/Fnr family transcriptional regulator [Pseudomonas sp.]
MSGADALPVLNQLIEHLPNKPRHSLLQRCELVNLEFGSTLCERGQPFRHLYFPLTGFISLVALTDGHPPLEMGLIGNEGMLGGMLTLGVNRVPLRAVVQGSGTALRMTASQFRLELRTNPALLRTLNRYLYVLMAQLAQTAACNSFHEVPARLARWLLMSHDRAHAEHFYLTHQFLAEMLGVQRSAVTIAAGALQQQGLIHYSRGKITVLSRGGLENVACECYAAVNNDYDALFTAPAVH